MKSKGTTPLTGSVGNLFSRERLFTMPVSVSPNLPRSTTEGGENIGLAGFTGKRHRGAGEDL